MTIATFSSGDFNQDTSRAEKAAINGPAFITDRGKPAHMLLSFEEYGRISGKSGDIVEALSIPGLSDIEVGFPRSRDLPRPADFIS